MRIDSRLASGLGLPYATVKNLYDFGRSSTERLRIAKLLREPDELQAVRIGAILTEDPEPQVRCEVALMLGSAGRLAIAQRRSGFAADALKQLKRLASDKNSQVRKNVALGCLRYGSERVFPTVRRLLEDDQPIVRLAAFKAYVGLLALHPKAAAKLQDVNLEALGTRFGPIDRKARKRWRTTATAGRDPESGVLTISPGSSTEFGIAVPRLHRGRAKLGEIFTLKVDEPPPGPEKKAFSFSKRKAYKGAPLMKEGEPAPADVTAQGIDEPPGTGGDEAPPNGGDGPGGGPPDEPKYITPAGPPRRYVNSWFVNHPSPLEPLRYFKEYTLGIEVSPQMRVGSLTTGDPNFKEPDFGEAEYLDVIVAIVTDDFEPLEKPAKPMRLPKDISKESERVTFKVRPIKNHQEVFINVLFYHRNSLFQESIIGARVETLESLKTPSATGYFPATDRLHTSSLRGSGDVNLQVVKTGDRYRFVLFYNFGEQDFDVMWCTLPVNQERLVNLIQGVRADLLNVIGTKVVRDNGEEKEVFYDGEPEFEPIQEKRLPKLYPIDDKTYASALKTLADAGDNLFVNLFFSGLDAKDQDRAQQVGLKLRELSTRRPLKIQILSDEFYLPWNLMYDGESEKGENPADRIWGFRHLIEELPGRRHDEGNIDDLMDIRQDALSLGMNLNKVAINQALIGPHLGIHSAKPPVKLLARYTEEEVLTALQEKAEQAQLEYFYCHAGVNGDPQQNFDQSYIGLTSANSGLTLKDIKLKAIGKRFHEQPVVFLNACESTRMDGRFYDGFVRKFLIMGARTVVGSDCDIPSLFGAHFGIQFLKAFLQGDSIGEALLKLRKEYLTEYQNPLGLIYRVFGNADVHLSATLIQR